MRKRLRIQLRPRWEDEPPRKRYVAMRPVPRIFKLCACLGIVMFWVYFFGWLGDGGAGGMEIGFLLFALGQLPLIWHWMRHVSRLNKEG